MNNKLHSMKHGQYHYANLSLRTFALLSFILPISAFGQTISGGWASSLAVCSDNTAMAWGGNLGNGTNDNSNVPVRVSTLSGIIAIAAAGQLHSLALKNDGTVWAWGSNSSGQLGNGTTTGSNVPVQVDSLTGITAITGGYSGHSLALKNDGTVWAWGGNSAGQLGNGTRKESKVPVQVDSLTEVIAIAAGDQHSLALKHDGTVWAWGDNQLDQLGNATTDGYSTVPVRITSLTGVIAIAGGLFHSLALKNDGTVWAWGSNTESKIPVQVSSLTDVIAIAVGGYHFLALKNDGTVWGWGNNDQGQLGNGTTGGLITLPVQVSSLTGVVAIAAGSEYSLALKNDGTAWAWGINFAGQLGNGTTTASNVPVQVLGLCTVLTSGIADGDVAGHVAVLKNYPNPASETTTISFTVTIAGMVSIEVFDALSKNVAVLVRQSMQPGSYQTTFDTRSLASGVYYYRLQTGDGMETKRLVVIR